MALLKTIGRVIVFLLCCTNVISQSYLEFIENKGQWEQKIKFKGDMSVGSFALQATGYRVLLHNKDDLNRLGELAHGHTLAHNEPKINSTNKLSKLHHASDVVLEDAGSSFILRSHVYEMRFLNSNKNPLIIPDKALDTHTNYFIGNDSSKWASDCRTFYGITYKNVYPNIDVRYYTANGILKYDFIINPGGDVSNIAMYFDGVEG